MNDELAKSMYYGATPSTLKKAWQLRNKMTSAEELLWEKLKGKQICNVRFRRQHPIYLYIVDFYCHPAKLVIELDGKYHLRTKKEDRERTEQLKSLNLDVIRFTNDKVETNINKVLEEITLKVKHRLEINS